MDQVRKGVDVEQFENLKEKIEVRTIFVTRKIGRTGSIPGNH